MTKLVKQAEVAEHLDLSVKQVQRLIKQGVLPDNKAHGYDLDESRRAYINFLRAARRYGDSGDSELMNETDAEIERRQSEATLKLTEERAKELELRNQKAEGDVVPVEYYVWMVGHRVMPELVSILDTLPLTMRRKHPDLTANHIASLDRELTRCRNLMADAPAKIEQWTEEFTREEKWKEAE